MDITITWAIPLNQLPADEYDVLYKVWDPIGLNNWILANPSPLPNNTTTYTITGLNPNTIYRVAVTKSCVGTASYVDEATYVNIVCPIVSFWQGPKVNSEQTLFYSVNYPDATHVTNTEILVYDTTFDDRFLSDCGSGPTSIPIGRTSYQIVDGCTLPNIVNCVRQIVDHNVPNTGVSAVGYYGLDTIVGFNPVICNGLQTDPILFREGNTYKFELTTIIDEVALGVTIDFSTFDTTCTLAPSAPVYTFTSHPIADVTLLSSALCVDVTTGLVNFTIGDGTDTTDIIDYTFSYTTSDGAPPNLPLLDNAGNPITTNNGSYNIYAPIKIETFAPGGGNLLGYTITNAVVSGPNTTYTYIGGTNAFTVGQDVFVNSINPVSFSFIGTSKTIIAATTNSFTVAFTPIGTYQTGGVASGYTELTNGMTITVDLQPTQNVITLINQNYIGLTLIQALTQIATAINTAGIYTASAVVIAGLPYLKIDVPNSTYTSASVLFEGPNILTKGSPDIPQISQNGTAATATSSSILYNDYLYAAYNSSSTAEIIASDTNLIVAPASYGHTIDLPLFGITLVDEIPPTTVHSIDWVGPGGNYSLNIATNYNTGYVYVADNTTITIYDGTTIIDSQDISFLVGGSTKPIRLLEYNSFYDYLYVFLDGATSNFHIILNPSVGVWSIGHTGLYNQTNYLERNTITAWNNLTIGPTAAMGTITSAPTAPIPCATIPCACIIGGPVSPPCGTVPNWQVRYNDGVRSELFQDSTKTWPPTATLYNNSFYVYNYNTKELGVKVAFASGNIYFPLEGISGDTIRISAAVDSVLTAGVPTYSSYSSTLGDAYGLFNNFRIVDYNANFSSRSWENTARYLIEAGRNQGSNGFFNTVTPTVISPDDYNRVLPAGDKKINPSLGLDGDSEYLLYEIKDGGTCYNNSDLFIYVSLGNGTCDAIDNSGTVTNFSIYSDYPTNTTLINTPLQLVYSALDGNTYGIARDARLDQTQDDQNIYILNNAVQTGIILGSTRWNTPICGQIAAEPSVSKLYFTAKYDRTIYEYDTVADTFIAKVIPSLYEKFDGYEYGSASPLLRLQGPIERIQGANWIAPNKFVVMNYLQQTYSTELKYVYDVANLFVYNFQTNLIEQVLIGTGVNTYSGAANSYNLNNYGESFGINDYNNDYCYGGLSIKVNTAGKVFWKKSISDQVYVSESHAETGVAQIWGTHTQNTIAGRLIRIWNIQSNGTLQQSKRTILDGYSSFGNILYDSFNERVLVIPLTQSNVSSQFYAINPKNLAGSHGVNDNGATGKYGVVTNIGGLAISTFLNGKPTTVYNVVVTPTTITYFVRPTSTAINGVFPHKYAVGELVKISGIISTPVDELNFPNPNIANAVTITAITATSFTIPNVLATTATYTSGGTVVNQVFANIFTASNFGSIAIDDNGNIIIIGTGSGLGLPGYNNPGTTFILKYDPTDLFTQRENPQIYTTGVTNLSCVSTPDALFRGLGAVGVGRAWGYLNNQFILHVPAQNTYWILGSKNPPCTISGITNAVYDSLAQTIRYFISNDFIVGKVINISGITPSTFILNRVTITAVDPSWIEISYTGSSPGTYVSGGTISLSANYVIKVLDDTTFASVATIDLSFINTLMDSYTDPDTFYGRFQYFSSANEIYLYSNLTSELQLVFSTVSNSLIRSSTFNRMLLPYNQLTNVFTLENVNGIPYFSGYAATETPTRFWFRLDLGFRNYQNNTHNFLNMNYDDGVTIGTDTYDLYSFVNSADTFGQWKVTTATTWASIPGGSNIVVNPNDIIEFVMFSTDNVLVNVENVTTSVLYDIPSYTNLLTYPTYNTLNSITAFAIKADSVNLTNGDILQFTFSNPLNPSCLFVNTVTINF